MWRVACVVAAIAMVASGHAAARIPRDKAQVGQFRARHPCPSTGRVKGACSGWQVDHIVPLCAGGADAPGNMQWISVDDHRFKTFIDVRECRRMKSPR